MTTGWNISVGIHKHQSLVISNKTNSNLCVGEGLFDFVLGLQVGVRGCHQMLYYPGL